MSIKIPPAALEAGARAIADSLRTARLTLESDDGYKPEARAAFLAMIEAWPGMLADGDLASGENGPPLHLVNAIILPLPPQENSDDQ